MEWGVRGEPQTRNQPWGGSKNKPSNCKYLTFSAWGWESRRAWGAAAAGLRGGRRAEGGAGEEVGTYLPSSCRCLPPPSWGCWRPSSRLGMERRGNRLSQNHRLAVCVPAGQAPRAPRHGWHLGRAPPPQGTAARRGQGWGCGDGAAPAPPTNVTPESRNRGQGGCHLPLTVPRGLCKTEGRGQEMRRHRAPAAHTPFPTLAGSARGERPCPPSARWGWPLPSPPWLAPPPPPGSPWWKPPSCCFPASPAPSPACGESGG